MKRLVIHPKDCTTEFLRAVYEGAGECEVYDGRLTGKRVRQLFHHCPETTQIMLLGHGSPLGLYWREGDAFECYIGHPHTHYLKMHRNMVGIFCYADEFARAERLHGLFSGMIISELHEAEEQGVRSSEEEVRRENAKFAARLRALLDEGCPLSEIPLRMRQMDDVHSELTEFNYRNLFYL